MARPQIYALISLVTMIAVGGYYLIAATGGGDGDFASQLGSIFIRVILIAAGVQFVLDIAQSIPALSVDKDERDRKIDGIGFRNGYYVLLVVIFAAIGQLAMSGLLGEFLDSGFLVSVPLTTLHILVLGTIAAVAVNAASRLFLYQKGV